MDLVAFLRARLDEDEAFARPLDAPAEQQEDPRDWSQVLTALGSDWYAHLVRHNPGQVLREVEAKRRILAEHLPRRPGFTSVEPGEEPGQTLQRHRERTDMVCSTCVSTSGRVPAPCPTVRLLLVVFDQHPDYDPEWKP